MPRSLYYGQDSCTSFGTFFGIKPHLGKWKEYHSLTRRISLKNDLGWHEVSNLQKLIRGADMWADFPARGLTLVAAETTPGDEVQRVDFLYLRNDGGLLPAELKIGGESKDTVGQLLRYIADLHFQNINLEYLNRKHGELVQRMKTEISQKMSEKKFREFIENNNISDKFIRLLPRHGLLIDEGFKPQLLKAVRYLNDLAGFSIQMIDIEAFVAEDWSPDSKDYIMRLDFTPIT